MTRIIAGVVLALHGFIHLIGFVVYWEIAEPEGFTYPTSLLADTIDVDDTVVRVLAVLWLSGAIGFVGSAISLVLRQSWWQPLTLMAGLLSLVLCALATPNAWAGVVLNIVILAIVLGFHWLAPEPTDHRAGSAAYKLEGQG